MTEKNPRADQGARAGMSIAADSQPNSTDRTVRPNLGIARTDHLIGIRKSPCGVFSVVGEPPVPSIEPRIFGDIGSARGHAGGLRLAMGFAKRDETGENGNG